MKIRTVVRWTPIALLLALALVALVSWIGSIYGLPVNSLFSGDGIRWWVVNFIPNVSAAPFEHIIVGLMSLSVLKESGFLHAFGRNASLKCKRALSLSVLVLVLLCLTLAVMTLLPGAVLRNSFGSLTDSPFTSGLFGEVCAIVLVVSNVYGLSSGNFTNLDDTVKAHVALPGRCPDYFISLALVGELMGCLDYTGLLAQSSSWYGPVAWCLYLIPLCLSLSVKEK